MCGRITQKSDPKVLGLKIVTLIEPSVAPEDARPRFNGAPGQQHWVIRQHPKSHERHLDRLWWGLIPNWSEPSPKLKPINATAERVATAPMFRQAFAKRRALLPVDSFFEWTKAKGKRAKQPFAIAMQDGQPFALAAIWESWRNPESGDIVRTFCVLTTEANALQAPIHDRMPVILPPAQFDRWLSALEPDPRDLLRSFPPNVMRMWPVSPRVNSAANDDADILDRVG